MSRWFEYEQKIDELKKECDGLKKTFIKVEVDRIYLELALHDACNLIAQISMEHDVCLLKNQKFCRDCPIEDCEEPFKWYNYFLENARHSPE